MFSVKKLKRQELRDELREMITCHFRFEKWVFIYF